MPQRMIKKSTQIKLPELASSVKNGSTSRSTVSKVLKYNLHIVKNDGRFIHHDVKLCKLVKVHNQALKIYVTRSTKL